jgi:hypothetical protein
MTQAAHFLICWAIAFATLCVAVLLLNIFYAVINTDLGLLTLRKELAVAGFASLFEGAAIWLMVSPLHVDVRILFPALIILGIIYRFAHLTEWSGYEVGGLLLFQIGIWSIIASLVTRNFGTAFVILAMVGAVLGIIAYISRSL